MKILEVTAFSAGICGLWTRVLAESEMLAKKGHEVHVFSSNILRGTDKIEIAPNQEKIGKVQVTRFPTKGSFGQNTFFWEYEEQALKLKPDIIVTHAYRQYYATNALKIAKKLKIPCFLVTHAPFLDKKLRSKKLNSAVFLYDNLLGKRILNKYTKILTITKWEIPYLLNLGVKKSKILYTPNGIPEEFFKSKIKKTKAKKNQITMLFLGRIAPIKDIKTLILAISRLKNKQKVKLTLVGPAEEEYARKIKNLIKIKKLEGQIIFLPPIYDLKKKISLIDKHDLFMLSSKREGMPQSLIEAMAREKIVISSATDGGKEVIQDRRTGFLFDIGDHKQLAHLIEKIINMPSKERNNVQKSARKSVEQFSWATLVKNLEKIYTT